MEGAVLPPPTHRSRTESRKEHSNVTIDNPSEDRRDLCRRRLRPGCDRGGRRRLGRRRRRRRLRRKRAAEARRILLQEGSRKGVPADDHREAVPAEGDASEDGDDASYAIDANPAANDDDAAADGYHSAADNEHAAS